MLTRLISRPGGWAVFALVTGCGAGSSTTMATPPQPPAATATVNATPDIAFQPTPANVLPGGTVTFAFGSVAHNVFFDPAPGAPADIPGSNAGVSVDRTFTTAGTYSYNCHIHPGMRGTIVVGTTASTDPMSGGSGGYP
ncbi:MAG TPA: plastocyanin/azurin family copper-binding protein [Gemmatimonadaceae bacterium]